MPIILRPAAVVTPDPIAVDPTPTPSAPGQTRLTWWAPDGTEVPLSRRDLGWRLLRGVRGLGPLSPMIAAEPLAAGGAEVLNQYAPPRLITLPLRIGGAGPGEFVDRLDLVADWFGQTDTLGPGRLVVARPDGRRREIFAITQEFPEGDRGTGAVAETFLITLYCADPWFRDTETLSVERRPATPRRYLGPGYPALSSGRTLGATTVYNRGTVPAYPVWTVMGPATSLTATSARLGGQGFTLTFPTALTLGQQAVVVTDPLTASVTGPAGQDWFGGLGWPDAAALFPLLPGANPLTWQVLGGGWARMEYQPRYRGA